VIWADIRPDAEEGPRWIEIQAARELGLPDGEYPGLGTRFVQTR
jgi:hypothetical protein